MGPGWLPLKEPPTVHELSEARSQGVVRLKQMELITVMQIQILLCVGRAQLKKVGAHLMCERRAQH